MFENIYFKINKFKFPLTLYAVRNYNADFKRYILINVIKNLLYFIVNRGVSLKLNVVLNR